MNAPLHTGENPETVLDVAIIGAGFSGLCMAIALKKAGYTSFRIFDKTHDLGGTWRDNRYPGSARDVPSHLYSFSFEQNPDWSRNFSPQREIWRYMKDCASKYAILPYISFGTRIVAARYDGAARMWRLRSNGGESIAARVVISGVGALHLRAYPRIEGLGAFKGRAFHSSEWDETFNPSGKYVGVIGTGASAIQIVPSIAPQVNRLYLFQRTPSWILPRMDRAFSQHMKKRFRSYPVLQRMFRHLIYLRTELSVLGFLGNRRFMKQAEKTALAFLERSIPDKKLRAALTPDYAIGCKRILISDDFYASLTRDNVELVTTPIAHAEADGIVTGDGAARKVDTLIYATGFRATDMLSEIEIVGRSGRRLSEDWRKGAEAYYGIAVSGYPNFFMLLGPNTGLGHNSIIFMIEAQVRYIMDCLNWLLRDGKGEIDVRADVQRTFNEALKTRMSRTVRQSGCRSWYLNQNGTNSTIWPSCTVGYWWQTRRARKSDFALDSAEASASL